jgi:hypothetical protein
MIIADDLEKAYFRPGKVSWGRMFNRHAGMVRGQEIMETRCNLIVGDGYARGYFHRWVVLPEALIAHAGSETLVFPPTDQGCRDAQAWVEAMYFTRG